MVTKNESSQPIYNTKIEGIDIMVPMRDNITSSCRALK